MNTNNNFSFHRLGMVMKRDLLENWKTNLLRLFEIYILFLLVYLFVMASITDGYHPRLDDYIKDFFLPFEFIVVSVLLYGASLMMEQMRTKELRTSYLMLPATSWEKFLSRSLYATVGIFFLLMVASIMAEMTHYFFRPLFDIPEELKVFVLPKVWNFFGEIVSPFDTYYIRQVINGVDTVTVISNIYKIITVSAICLWFHSLFVLGGNMWKKYAFVKTLILLFIVSGAFTFSLIQLVREGMIWVNQDGAIDEPLMFILITIFFLTLTVFHWWLAYRLFTRSQVVKPKFICYEI